MRMALLVQAVMMVGMLQEQSALVRQVPEQRQGLQLELTLVLEQ